MDAPETSRRGWLPVVHLVALGGSTATLVALGRAAGRVVEQEWLELGFLRTALGVVRAELLESLVPALLAVAGVCVAAQLLRLVPAGRRLLSLDTLRRVLETPAAAAVATALVLAFGVWLLNGAAQSKGSARQYFAAAGLSTTAGLLVLLHGTCLVARLRGGAGPGLVAFLSASSVTAVVGLHVATARNRELLSNLTGVESLWSNAGIAAAILLGFGVLLRLATPRPASRTVVAAAWGPALVGLALAFVAPALVEGSVVVRNPKSVLVVGVDTLRVDHTSLGPRQATEHELSPQVARLADGGTVFRAAVSQAPWTMPAFASILTGRYPREHGASSLVSRLGPQELTLAEILREAGYATAAVVSNDLVDASHGFGQGFDSFSREQVYGVRGSSAAGVTDEGLALLDAFAAGGEPFFLFLHYYDPHYEFEGRPELDWADGYDGWIDRTQNDIVNLRHKRHLLGEEDVRYLLDNYAEEVQFTDRQIGRVLDRVSELGLDGDVAVVFTSDHGEEFLEHGWLGHTISMYEEVLHVPLVLRLPGITPVRGVVDRVVETRLAFDTILGYLGAQGPFPVGPGLLPVLSDESEAVAPGIAFSSSLLGDERPGSGKRVELYAVRQGDWKYIRDSTRDVELLFDLSRDPRETRDLAGDEPERLAALRELLDTWRDSLGGPRRKLEVDADGIEQLEALGYL